jgi:cell division inhibitor SulA
VTESERREEWLRHLSVCSLRLNALFSIQEKDGNRMLAEVLRELKLTTVSALLAWLKESDSK